METEKGENWFVIVISCKLNSFESTLLSIWKIAYQHNLRIPHFRFCARSERTVLFSFRGYLEGSISDNNETKNKIINELLELKNNENEVECLTEGRIFNEFQKWILKGDRSEIWNFNRCEALHYLSKYVIYLIENGLFINSGEMSRQHSIHMLINMVGLQEAPRYLDLMQK